MEVTTTTPVTTITTTPVKKRPHWTLEETRHLVKAYIQHVSADEHVNEAFWKKLADELKTDHNMERSATECTTRYRNIIRTYRKAKATHDKPEEDRIEFNPNYAHDLIDIFYAERELLKRPVTPPVPTTPIKNAIRQDKTPEPELTKRPVTNIIIHDEPITPSPTPLKQEKTKTEVVRDLLDQQRNAVADRMIQDNQFINKVARFFNV